VEFIKDKMNKSDNFYLTKNLLDKKIAIFFLPVMNLNGDTNSTYMVIYEDSKTLVEIENNYEKIILILLLIVFIFFIVLKYQYEKILQNYKKEEILSQQSKMIAMGEMIENIAHQWRQPLSIISTVASGVKLEKEVGILDDAKLLKFMDTIVYQSHYLSETIDDFRNFFDNDRRKEIVNINDLIDKSLSVFGNSFKDSNINIVLNIENFSISTYPNDLKQVIINILKNAKDAIVKDGVIIIKSYVNQKNKNVYILIQDSGGGISNDIKNKIFEPYFTTKHKSQGTGIGLYMSYNIINKHLEGSIEIDNRNFDYNFKKFKGALFTIKLKNLPIYGDKKNEI
jgi:signal transduction histidine kinase